MPAGGLNNPVGNNQHGGPLLASSDETLRRALEKFHHCGLTNNKTISELLRVEDDIVMSPYTVKRRRKDLGLFSSGKTTRETPTLVKTQMVLNALADDPGLRRGPRTVKQDITERTGVHLTRDFIGEVMHAHSPEGFDRRKPEAKKIKRSQLVSAGPNDEWSGDGHDKLNKIGIQIYGIRDKASGYWLGLWAVPNNRIKEVVAYLYLELIEELGGFPIQSTTDCGSETTLQFGFAHALQERFYPDYVGVMEPHRYLRSTHNIVIEKGWNRFSMAWGNNIVQFFDQGIARGIYNMDAPGHYALAQWLWSTFLRSEFVHIRAQMNSYRVRFDKNKLLPSAASASEVYSLPEKYGLVQCLRPVDVAVVQEAKEEIGGAELLDFVTPEYAAHAEDVLASLGGLESVKYQNIWDFFVMMLPLM